MAQYEKMFNKYIAWSKANDVELTVITYHAIYRDNPT